MLKLVSVPDHEFRWLQAWDIDIDPYESSPWESLRMVNQVMCGAAYGHCLAWAQASDSLFIRASTSAP